MSTSPIERVLQRACDLLSFLGVPYHFYGGLVVAAWGDPRNTRDVDVVVIPSVDTPEKILSGGADAGFFFDPERARLDLLTSKFTRMGLGRSHLDLFLGSTPFDRAASARRRRIILFGHEIDVASAEDLIVYKLVAGRPRDLSDVESILVRQRGTLSVSYMEEWVSRISQDLGRPEVVGSLERLLRLRYR